MTTPIDPGNTAALFTVLDNAIVWAIDNDMTPKAATRYGAVAVALAVCPSDCVVVRRDDITAIIAFLWNRNLIMAGDWDVVDRLRALIGDEG